MFVSRAAGIGWAGQECEVEMRIAVGEKPDFEIEHQVAVPGDFWESVVETTEFGRNPATWR